MVSVARRRVLQQRQVRRFVHVESGAIKRHWCDRKEHGKPHTFVCHPDGFCSWGQPRENPCRNADADAAAFADAPMLEIASEPPKTPLLELGAQRRTSNSLVKGFEKGRS